MFGGLTDKSGIVFGVIAADERVVVTRAKRARLLWQSGMEIDTEPPILRTRISRQFVFQFFRALVTS